MPLSSTSTSFSGGTNWKVGQTIAQMPDYLPKIGRFTSELIVGACLKSTLHLVISTEYQSNVTIGGWYSHIKGVGEKPGVSNFVTSAYISSKKMIYVYFNR